MRLADQLLAAFADQRWDQPHCVLLIAKLGATVGSAAGFGDAKRIVTTADGEQVAVYPVPNYEKPWLALERRHAPDWADAVATIGEAWMNENRVENGYDSAVAMVQGASKQLDRIEVRLCTVTTRSGEHASNARRRDGQPTSHFDRAEAPTGGDRHLRAYLGLDGPDEPPPIRDFLGAIGAGATVSALLRVPPQERGFVVAGYFQSGLSGISELHADYPTWADYRAKVSSGTSQLRVPAEKLVDWFGPNDWAAEAITQAGTVNDHVIHLAEAGDLQLARAFDLLFSITEGRPLDAYIDVLVPEAKGKGVAADLPHDADTSQWPVTPFGIPFTAHHAAPREPTKAAGAAAVEHWERCIALVQKSGRPRSERRVAGDVARVIADLASSEVAGAADLLSHGGQTVADIDGSTNELADLVLHAAQTGSEHRLSGTVAVTKATPFFIDTPTAYQVAGAHLPEADFTDYLRLPFPAVLVVFDQDMGFEDVADDVIDPLVGAAPDTMFHLFAWSAALAGGWGSALGELARYGGGLAGVTLYADEDGRLSDWVDWIINTRADPRERLSGRTWAIPGHLPHSTLRYVALNLAAYVCWGGFAPPKDLPLPDPSSKEWRNATRTSQFRKLEPRGAALGVHVITATAAQANNAAVGSGRTVTGHLRRGHWRRNRIAIRHHDGTAVGSTTGPDAVYGTTYTYRQNFIAPVAVAGGPSGERLAIYRLPIAADTVETAPEPQPEEND